MTAKAVLQIYTVEYKHRDTDSEQQENQYHGLYKLMYSYKPWTLSMGKGDFRPPPHSSQIPQLIFMKL